MAKQAIILALIEEMLSDICAECDKSADLKESDLGGFRFFKKLLPLLDNLRGAGCQRDTAGNRTLHYDQYVCLILLQLFNPAVATLRLIQQASELESVQQKLDCARTSLGSLSEAPHVFDPDLLLGIIGSLSEELKPLGRDPRLADVRSVITLVDGTLLKALPQLAQAMWLTTRTVVTERSTTLQTDFAVRAVWRRGSRRAFCYGLLDSHAGHFT